VPKGVYIRTKEPWNKGLTKKTDSRVAKGAEANRGMPNSPEHIEACRQAMLAHWQNPEFRARQLKSRNTQTLKEKRYQRMLGEKNPGFGNPPWNKGKTACYSDEVRQQMGADKKGKIPAMKGKHFPPEVVEKNRQAILACWQDPKYIAKQMEARGVRPNRLELKLLKILTPFGFQYVGDGQLIIGGKCPDFWNGDHKLIELYGDYWHSGDNPEERIDHFGKHGYDCLVIWEHELQNMEQMKAKVASHGKTNV